MCKTRKRIGSESYDGCEVKLKVTITYLFYCSLLELVVMGIMRS